MGGVLDLRTLAALTTLMAGFWVGTLLLPWRLLALCTLLSLIVSGVMLTVRAWPRRLFPFFAWRVPVPRWLVLGGILLLGSLVLLDQSALFTRELIPWIVLFALGLGRVIGYAEKTGRFRKRDRIPCWGLMIFGVAVAGPIAALFGLVPVLTVVFVTALLLFALQTWVIMPLAVYQYHQEPSVPPASEPFPFVSVLIPAYNEEDSIGECIDSVLASTYPEDCLEVIVIDDGSEERTYERATTHGNERVHVIQRENGGKHAALNMGLCFATGEFIVSIDADSLVAPDAIDTLVGQFQTDSNVGGLAGSVYVENDDSHLAKMQALEYAFSIQAFRRVYSLFDVVPVLPGCLAAFRREAIEGVWGFDPDTQTEDFDITVKILRDGWKTRHSPAKVSTYVPTDWRSFWRQRRRWFGGNVETLLKHRDVCSKPAYGFLHGFVIPVRWLSTVLIPLVSTIVIAAVFWMLVFWPTGYVLAAALFFLFLTVLLLWVPVAMDDLDIKLLGYAPLFFVGYKHVLDTNLAISAWKVLRGREEEW